uniref:Uncharacterized protein n=1 Tax=Brassica oleracea TaxID=3712 RepID=A0A3P6FV58_BRAOL|nr:unnamed protein product [Brassica oleracea]
MLFDLRCCGFGINTAPPSSRRGSCGFGSGEARNVKRGGELVWVDMLMVDVNVSDPYIYIYIYIYIYDVYFKLRYRVEMAIADDTAERTFVRFDGVMTKLHNLRAK